MEFPSAYLRLTLLLVFILYISRYLADKFEMAKRLRDIFQNIVFV